jgi:hypothetical protein
MISRLPTRPAPTPTPPHRLTAIGTGYRADAPDGRRLASGFGRTPEEAELALRLALGLQPVGPGADRIAMLRFLSAWGRAREEAPMRDPDAVARVLDARGLLAEAEWTFGPIAGWVEEDRGVMRGWVRRRKVGW